MRLSLLALCGTLTACSISIRSLKNAGVTGDEVTNTFNRLQLLENNLAGSLSNGDIRQIYDFGGNVYMSPDADVGLPLGIYRHDGSSWTRVYTSANATAEPRIHGAHSGQLIIEDRDVSDLPVLGTYNPANGATTTRSFPLEEVATFRTGSDGSMYFNGEDTNGDPAILRYTSISDATPDSFVDSPAESRHDFVVVGDTLYYDSDEEGGWSRLAPGDVAPVAVADASTNYWGMDSGQPPMVSGNSIFFSEEGDYGHLYRITKGVDIMQPVLDEDIEGGEYTLLGNHIYFFFDDCGSCGLAPGLYRVPTTANAESNPELITADIEYGEMAVFDSRLWVMADSGTATFVDHLASMLDTDSAITVDARYTGLTPTSSSYDLQTIGDDLYFTGDSPSSPGTGNQALWKWVDGASAPFILTESGDASDDLEEVESNSGDFVIFGETRFQRDDQTSLSSFSGLVSAPQVSELASATTGYYYYLGSVASGNALFRVKNGETLAEQVSPSGIDLDNAMNMAAIGDSLFFRGRFNGGERAIYQIRDSESTTTKLADTYAGGNEFVSWMQAGETVLYFQSTNAANRRKLYRWSEANGLESLTGIGSAGIHDPIYGMTVFGDDVYFIPSATGGGGADLGPANVGKLQRILATETVPTQISNTNPGGADWPQTIFATTDDFIYASCQLPNATFRVFRFPRASTSGTQVLTIEPDFAFAAGDSLYYIDNLELFRVPTSSTTAVQLSDAANGAGGITEIGWYKTSKHGAIIKAKDTNGLWKNWWISDALSTLVRLPEVNPGEDDDLEAAQIFANRILIFTSRTVDTIDYYPLVEYTGHTTGVASANELYTFLRASTDINQVFTRDGNTYIRRTPGANTSHYRLLPPPGTDASDEDMVTPESQVYYEPAV